MKDLGFDFDKPNWGIPEGGDTPIPRVEEAAPCCRAPVYFYACNLWDNWLTSLTCINRWKTPAQQRRAGRYPWTALPTGGKGSNLRDEATALDLKGVVVQVNLPATDSRSLGIEGRNYTIPASKSCYKIVEGQEEWVRNNPAILPGSAQAEGKWKKCPCCKGHRPEYRPLRLRTEGVKYIDENGAKRQYSAYFVVPVNVDPGTVPVVPRTGLPCPR
jgi:hypothetical protein